MLHSVQSDKITAIIFDLGGVILNLDYQRTAHALQKLIPSLDLNSFYGKDQQHNYFSQYELGRITTDELLQSLNQHYRINLKVDDFAIAWNAMILDFPITRIEKLKKIAQNKRTFLLSNINALHEEAVELEYAKVANGNFRSLFEKAYYSHLTGMRKPHASTFETVLIESDLNPSETLFIDDSLHHIKGAESVGILTAHVSRTQTLEDILSKYNL